MFFVSFLISILSGISTHGNVEPDGQCQLMSSSYVVINGTSNINSFSCNYSFSNYQKDSFFNTTSVGSQYMLDSVTVKIPVNAFDCGNRYLKKDFMNTLQHQNHPEISMRMRSLVLNKKEDTKNIHSEVSLNIGGISQNQHVIYHINRIDENTFIMEGKALIDITDFNLEPASHFFGMVKVDKEVEIHFFLKFVIQ